MAVTYQINIIVEGQDRASAPLGRAGSALGNMAQIAGGILGADLFRNIANGIFDMGRQALDQYAWFERLGMSLQSLSAREILNAGGASDLAGAMKQASGTSQELLGWIQQLAIKSPFTQTGVADAFRTAMAYGFTTKEAQRLTGAMIDFSSATGGSEQSMNMVALALGQIKAKGKLAGQEVLQLTNAGLNVRDILAKAFGVTTAELVKMQEKGLIPADKAIEAIVSSLEHDFGGAAEKQAETFSGLISSLEDIKNVGLRELFSGVFEAAKPAVTGLVNLLSSPAFMASLKNFGQNIGTGIKAALDWFGRIGKAFPDLMAITRHGDPFGALKIGLGLLLGGPIPKQLTEFINGIQANFDKLAGPVANALDLITVAGNNFSAFWQATAPALGQIFLNLFGNLVTILTDLAGKVIPWLASKFEFISAWFVANQPLIQAFWDQLATSVTNIIGVIANMWQFVQPLLDALIAIILDIGTFIMQGVTGDWTGAWQTLQDIVNTAWEGVKGFFNGFVNWVLQTFLGTNMAEFKGTWKGIFENAKTIVDENVSKIKGFIDGISGTIDGVIQKVKDFIGNLIQMGKDLLKLKIPDWLQRHSPAPIEVVMTNWLDTTKKMNLALPALRNNLNMPAPAFAGQGASVTNKKEYNLYLATSQSPEVVRNSFSIMEVMANAA